MKHWKFTTKRNTKEVFKSLRTKGFVFQQNDKTNFTLRKRILYPFYLIFQNSLVVSGKMVNTADENETEVEISFQQHFLWKSLVVVHQLLFLAWGIALIVQSNFVTGTLLLGASALLWSAVRLKYQRNIAAYKTLFTKLLLK